MIGRWNLHEIAKALGAEVKGPDVEFGRVSQDTRRLEPGALYVAIRGERFDGHDFLAQAGERGAVAALVERFVDSPLPQMRVADARRGLGQLGLLNRQRFSGRVAAVTGSSGKTTTKEMLASILRQGGRVLATRGNLNNELGVPLTLLELDADTEYAVIEMGASAIGEIAYSVRLAAPDVAAITNASGAHLEGFGGLEGVRRAKGEILEGLGPQGVAVLNREDPGFPQWLETMAGRQVLSFGWQDADFTARNWREEDGLSWFEMVTPAGVKDIRLPFSGRHNLANALAAAAMAHALGLSLEQIAQGLASAAPVAGRLTRLHTRAGGLLLDDTYNANPASMRAAIEVLAAQPGTRVALLGLMAELGPDAERLHEEVGRFAREQGIDRLLACGPFAQAMARGFGEGAQAFAEQADLIGPARALCQPGVAVLVKGSRSARMERVVAELRQPEEEPRQPEEVCQQEASNSGKSPDERH